MSCGAGESALLGGVQDECIKTLIERSYGPFEA